FDPSRLSSSGDSLHIAGDRRRSPSPVCVPYSTKVSSPVLISPTASTRKLPSGFGNVANPPFSVRSAACHLAGPNESVSHESRRGPSGNSAQAADLPGVFGLVDVVHGESAATAMLSMPGASGPSGPMILIVCVALVD